MSRTRIYLDHNASTPLLPVAKDALVAVLDKVGNPSSVHEEGRTLRQVMDTARRQVAHAAGAEPGQVVFTGSATEAITQAVAGGVKAFGVDRVVVSAGEHAAVLRAAETSGVPVTKAGLLPDGRMDVAELKSAVERADANDELLLVAVHAVNNETGVIQPLGQIEALIGPTRHLLFVDAVQAFGKMELGFAARAADMLAISAHKIGGPAGIGALLVKPHCNEVRLVPGGGQEQGRRGGTESAALIAGFGAAAEGFANAFDLETRRGLVARFEDGLKRIAPEAAIFGADAPRLGTASNFAIPGVKNAVAMMALDLDGIALSSGSACSSGKVAASHVLDAMAVTPNLLECALRLSVGWTSTESEIDDALTGLEKLVARQRNQKGKAA